MITLSENAQKKVKEFFEADPETKGKALRVSVEPGGCSGYQYAFGFDLKREQDTEITCNGFSVVIGPESIDFLKGSSIDYAEDTAGSGFKIANPNVKKSCGCGQSNSF